MLTPKLGLLFVAAACSFPAQAQDLGTPTQSAAQAPPSAPEQQELLARVQQYASAYVSNLPNFICRQTTTEFQAGKNSRHWHRSGTLTFKLTYYRGREDRTLALVNGKPAIAGRAFYRNPLETEGEFALLIASVFDSSTKASFAWSKWDTLNGKRVAVFSYDISREHSPLRLTLSDVARAVIPYHGDIYSEPNSGAIWRMTSVASDIPAELETKSIATTIDYQQTIVGGKPYVLPLAAAVLMETETQKIRNQIEFAEYRKFETDSNITYASDVESAPDHATGPQKPPEFPET